MNYPGYGAYAWETIPLLADLIDTECDSGLRPDSSYRNPWSDFGFAIALIRMGRAGDEPTEEILARLPAEESPRRCRLYAWVLCRTHGQETAERLVREASEHWTVPGRDARRDRFLTFVRAGDAVFDNLDAP